jgi:hypothetical protein
MSRTLSSAILTAFGLASVPRMLLLVRLDFDSGSVCWNSSLRPLVYGGKTYMGAGALGAVADCTESAGVKASGLTVSLSGVKAEIIAALLTEPYLNRPAYIHMALLDGNDAFTSADVALLFVGKIDAITGVQGRQPSFSVSIKSRLADWERSRSFKYTDADQQRVSAGDKGMEYIPQLSQKKIIWPLAAFLPDSRG